MVAQRNVTDVAFADRSAAVPSEIKRSAVVMFFCEMSNMLPSDRGWNPGERRDCEGR